MPESITEKLDNLYSTTWANRRAGVADQVFDATAFWFWLKKHGMMEQETGGRRIEETLRYAKSDNVAWIGKGAKAEMNDVEHLNVAYYDWRYLIDSIVRFWEDDQQNAGKPQILKLMNSKIDTSNDTLIEEFEKRLFGKSTDADAPGDYTPILGLQELVADDPTAANNPTGHIPQNTYTWWRNKTYNMTGESFATNGFRRMQKMLNDCSNNLGMDRPQIIVSGQDPYEYYDEDVTTQRRIVNKMLGDMGFENIEFKGVPMVWSSYCTDRMYFLNTRFIKLIYDPRFFLDMTEWKYISNQPNDRVAQIVTACALCTNRRRTHGVIYNVDTI